MSIRKTKKTLGDIVKAVVPAVAQTEEKTSEMLSANRAGGEKIKDTLQQIPFHKNRIHNEQEPDFLQKMKTMRNGLVEVLDKTDPIGQDISAIDEQLQYAAAAWSSAVTEGYYGKAKWSIAALSRGVKNFRTVVPGDKAGQASEVIKKRLAQAEVYTSLIKNAEAIDAAEKAIQNITVQLNEHNEKLEPIRQEVMSARTDPEKLKMIAKLKAIQLGKIKATDLDDTERAFRDLLNEGVSLRKGVDMLKNELETAKIHQNNARNMFAASRAKLSTEELTNNEELIATYTKVLGAMAESTQSALAEAEKVRQGFLTYQSQMEAVWNTVEGKNVVTDTVDFVEDTLTDGNKSDHVVIAIGILNEINEKNEENKEKEEQLIKLMQESKNENENHNYNTNT